MKKIKQYISYGSILLLLLFPALAGCSDDNQMAGDNPEIITGQRTYLSVNAVANTVASEDEEDKVHTIRVIAYRTGTYTSPLCNEFFEVNGSMSTDAFEMKSGKADLYVIVNETSEMNLEGHITVPEIKENIFKITHLSNPISTKGLPMYQEYEAVVIRQHPHNNPLVFTAEVDRIMAKLTLRISNSTHKDILLDKVEVKSLPSNSWLAPETYKDVPSEAISKDLVLKIAGDRSSYEDVSLYIPEYMVADAAKRSYLYITGKSDKGFDCKYTISLGHGLQAYRTDVAVKKDIGTILTAESFNIIRNTHYEILVNDIRGYEHNKLTFLIGITPWDNIPENYYEGGTWVKQPVSSRIPINGTTSFKAEFTHTDAPTIVYKWYRSQYKQTATTPLPAEPTVELLLTEELPKGVASTLFFLSSTDTIKPYISGDIFCMAAPISASNFRESSHATLMVIGDWDGESRNFYPKMQTWNPPVGAVSGTSYLLLDDRDDTYGGKKIYRVKLMADGNWWMIQDLAYSEKEPTPLDKFNLAAGMGNWVVGSIGDDLYGACCTTDEDTGGYLYTAAACVGNRVGVPSVATETEFYTLQGLCPDGWHLAGNSDAGWNGEWAAFNTVLGGITKESVGRYNYFNPSHFNAYTNNIVITDRGQPIYKADGSFNYWGGYIVLSGAYISIGVKFDSSATIVTNPMGADLPFTMQDAVPIRCVRNN